MSRSVVRVHAGPPTPALLRKPAGLGWAGPTESAWKVTGRGVPDEAIVMASGRQGAVGGLAQLARAPALQAGGHRFESDILHGSLGDVVIE
jgi:hypothetical protein